jgi:hypothetical protein
VKYLPNVMPFMVNLLGMLINAAVYQGNALRIYLFDAN